VGLDQQQWEQLSQASKKNRLRNAQNILRRAGADYVAEDLASCNQALAKIEKRLKNGK
jgi:hypothetical protein